MPRPDATNALESVQERLLERVAKENWTGIEASLGQLVTIATEEVR